MRNKMAGAVARGGAKCLQVCGYCCQAVACGVETLKAIWSRFTKICTCGQGWKGLLRNTYTICGSEEDPDYKDFHLPVSYERRLTDVPSVLLFIVTLVGMCAAMQQGLAYGRPEVFANGVDSWGNVCGLLNSPISGATFSGQNATAFDKTLISALITKPESLVDATTTGFKLCVRVCPAVSKQFSCDDFLKEHSPYDNTIRSAICPASDANSQDMRFEEKNKRCAPFYLAKSLSIQEQNRMLNLYGVDWLHNLVDDCHVCAAELTWIALIACVFSLIFLVIVHGAAAALCWYSFVSFFLIGATATGCMWYLYTLINEFDPGLVETLPEARYSYKDSLRDAALRIFPQPRASLFPSGRNASESAPQAGYSIVFRDAAIYSTTVVIVFSGACLIAGRRNMEASAVLFDQACSALLQLKWIYMLPLFSLASISFGFGLWMYTVKYVTAIFKPELNVQNDPSTGLSTASYVPDDFYTNGVLVFEFLSIFWVLNFILACQNLIVSVAVATWYFSLEKMYMYRPMRVASSRLIRKHLGSAVAGSFLAGYFGFLRAPLSFIQSRVIASTENAKKLQHDQLIAMDKEDYYGYSTYRRPPPSAAPTSQAGEAIYDDVHTDAYSEAIYDDVYSKRGGSTARKESLQSTKKKPKKKKKEPDGYVAVSVWNTVNKGCSPFFWLQNNILIYISDLNYAMVALEGTWFLESGRKLKQVLLDRQHLKGITAISSYAFFLGKLTVTLSVLTVGFLLLKDKPGVFMYGYPLAVGALLAYFISHVFYSMLEAAVGSVYVCYLTDISLNDGTDDSPYFGQKIFFQQMESALNFTYSKDGPYDKVHHDNADAVKRNVQKRKDRVELLSETDGYSNVYSDVGSHSRKLPHKKKRQSRRSNSPDVFKRMPGARENVYGTSYGEYSGFDEFDDLDADGGKTKRNKKEKEKKRDSKNEEKQKDKEQQKSQKKKAESKEKSASSKPHESKKESNSHSDKQASKSHESKDKSSQRKETTKSHESKKESNSHNKDKQASKSHESKDKSSQRKETTKSHESKKESNSHNKDKQASKSHERKDPAKSSDKKHESKSQGKDQHKGSHKTRDNERQDSPKKSPKKAPAPQRPPAPHKKDDKENKASHSKDKNAEKTHNKPDKKGRRREKQKSDSKHRKDQRGSSKARKKEKLTKDKSHGKAKGGDKMKKFKKEKVPHSGKDLKKLGKSSKKVKKPKLGKIGKKPKLGKKFKTPKLGKMGKKLKGGKMKKKLGKVGKIGKKKFKGNMGKLKGKLGGKGFGKKLPKMPKMKFKGRGGPKGGIMDGVEGAMNVADGLMRITGKKEQAESALQKTVAGTRNRAKVTTLIGHVVDNREKEATSWLDDFTRTRDLIQGGIEKLRGVDEEFDAMEEEYEYSSSD